MEDSMLIYDHLSHLTIADDQFDILAFPLPSKEELEQSLSSMILSASGWRKVFAEGGNEEDPTKSISYADGAITMLVALALARYLGAPLAQQGALQQEAPLESSPSQKSPTILVGLDARPTGRLLGDIICRTLLCLGCKVRYLFICAAPEIMADCNLHPEEADAFLYVSASHNPIGHNGFKFGKAGGVYPGAESKLLTDIFRSLFAEEGNLISLQKISSSLNGKQYLDVLNSVKSQKQQSLERYEKFILTTASKSDNTKDHYAFARSIIANTETKPLGILGELNGSARSVSIDFSFLKSLGLKVSMLNNKVGQVVHGIVPEGENLELCRQSLEELYAGDKAYLLGYVPDNDGDRGNLVYIRESTGKAEILEAQNVFSLVVLAELCQAHLENPQAKLAVAVNGPTSMRIDRICEGLGVDVFRSEVGEANVVELANMKRSEGYLVPILGEGSNGGNITHPAKVRDPMNTLMSLIKLVTQQELFALWSRVSRTRVPRAATLEAIIGSLPCFVTTPSFSDKGKMQVSSPQRALKQAYEELFLMEWETKREELKTMGITAYKVYQMEGTTLYQGAGEENRTEPYSGGYKIVFSNALGEETDFIWMRGSKTEPVFRVIADCQGSDTNRHDYLIDWQRSLIAKADELAMVTAKTKSH
jgi:phosphomannomutase